MLKLYYFNVVYGNCIDFKNANVSYFYEVLFNCL